VYFKQFLHDDLGCSSYFIASRQTREAVVVDPRLDVQPYLDLAAERGYAIAHVIDTHIHADHVSGNRALAAATGAKLHLHESAGVASRSSRCVTATRSSSARSCCASSTRRATARRRSRC
jgi:glyoxylase-like metal-dependent hydrolase (beta-lactamase superfamily II)